MQSDRSPVPPTTKRRILRPREALDLMGWSSGVRGPRDRLARVNTVEELRSLARRRTPRAVFDYVDGAAEHEISMRRSRRAYESIEWHPHVLRDVGEVDLTTEVLGRPVSMPLVLSPTGFTRMMHHHGERAVGYAAAKAGVPYALSTMGTVTPEELAAAAPSSDRWFQVYIWRDRDMTQRLIDRAAAAGYGALVLTVDTPVAGRRLRDERNGLSIPPSLTLKAFADMARFPRWWMNLLTTEPISFATLTSTEGTVAAAVDRVFDPAMTFDDVAWLRERWDGPILVKGVQRVDDAVRSVEAGADGVIISNHGGRQLDRTPVPLHLVPKVRAALGPDRTVLVDGGVLSGADMIAAVALGADAAMVGRAYLYGLMAGGHRGVARALEIFADEAARTMRLLGVTSIADLDEDLLRTGEN